jgi:hypothetical protein
MTGRVLLIVLRTLIGLALIAGGLAIEFLQYQPGLMPSVAIGNGIVGPFLSFVGAIVTFWPAVRWFFAPWRSNVPSGQSKRSSRSLAAAAS